MHDMIPHGVGMDFTWALTVGVVVYSAIAFVGYFLYNVVAKRRRRRGQGHDEGHAA
ncbi:MAG: hypothetical protein P8180_15510 [Gammaproteobacteria bacterium]